MDNFKSHFQFNKQERSGIFFLLFLIGILLIARYGYRLSTATDITTVVTVDSIKQKRIDSLKLLIEEQSRNRKRFRYNPNFITDYKGYVLGLSTEEIDRLHRYRKAGKYVNSTKEFQEVTLVSDSVLARISPDFQFPEWVTQKVMKVPAKVIEKRTLSVEDINLATAEDLKTIYGIGEKLSVRIIKFRDRLGGFRSMEMLHDVYGLEKKVIDKVKQRYQVIYVGDGIRLNLNEASEKELAEFVYFGKSKARKIAAYRYANGKIASLEDLFNNIGIPINKIDRIALYLSL